jgi:glycosyltransferase involved in cell wall biosynthesis
MLWNEALRCPHPKGCFVKVCHLTSVHPPHDPRILQRECRSLAAAGFEVVLVAPADRDEVVEGVQLRCVPLRGSRLARWARTIRDVYRRALDEDADVYHLHDPELLPVGHALRRRGKQVIYDVHEDYVTAILQKGYLPSLLRRPMASLADIAERRAARSFHVVLAERYYSERFPAGRHVLNYPVIDLWHSIGPLFDTVPRVLYTGSITVDRGALLHAKLVRLVPDMEVHLVGRLSGALRDRALLEAGPNADRLVMPFVDRYVRPGEILEYCRGQRWLAGLAVFPATPHYGRKELTKFFEYMAMGLPVIASHLPTWEALLNRTEAGFTVNSERLEEVVDAIELLRTDRAVGEGMGRAGRRAVQAEYSWASQARELVDLYHNVAPRR